jgi:hypothetical protein
MSNNTQRYEVVAPMPHFTHLMAMDILIPMVHPINENVPYWGREEDKDNPFNWVDFCPNFPHLFRLLKWWEGLAIDELPKYVKWVDGNDVEYFKVDKWVLAEPLEWYADGTLFTYGDGGWLAYNYDGEIYPSTEAEYQDYITKLNG